MKKSIKETPKAKSSSSNKKNTRGFNATTGGYKEAVFNSEEEKSYEKSEIAADDKKNTSGPK